MSRAYYALSGDPITNGHVWVIETAAEMFDRLVVAIAVNPNKRYTFSHSERIAMLYKTFEGRAAKLDFTTLAESEFVAKAARRGCAGYIVRGVRNAADYEYETQMARFNAKLEPSVTTVLLPTPADRADISSSFVKSLVGLEDWENVVRPYVPGAVLEMLKEWHGKRQVK